MKEWLRKWWAPVALVPIVAMGLVVFTSTASASTPLPNGTPASTGAYGFCNVLYYAGPVVTSEIAGNIDTTPTHLHTGAFTSTEMSQGAQLAGMYYQTWSTYLGVPGTPAYPLTVFVYKAVCTQAYTATRGGQPRIGWSVAGLAKVNTRIQVVSNVMASASENPNRLQGTNGLTFPGQRTLLAEEGEVVPTVVDFEGGPPLRVLP